MDKGQPLVSVCLPVYNGEKYIKEAIQSVLAQSYENLELVISDNASTDGTPEICQRSKLGDARVKYFRATVNGGLAWNFNRAFELTTGKYVVWISHDDRMAPDYVHQCVSAIDQDEEAILCFTNSYYIDADGEVTDKNNLPETGTPKSPSERFGQILCDVRCDPILGLIKRDYLKKTHLHPPYADSDRVLLAELGFRGRFRKLSDYLYFRRMHPLQATAFKDRWERTLVFDPKKKGTVICPWWRELFDLMRAVHQAPVPRDERLVSYKYLYWWFLIHRTFLFRDASRGFKSAMRQIQLGRPVERI